MHFFEKNQKTTSRGVWWENRYWWLKTHTFEHFLSQYQFLEKFQCFGVQNHLFSIFTILALTQRLWSTVDIFPDHWFYNLCNSLQTPPPSKSHFEKNPSQKTKTDSLQCVFTFLSLFFLLTLIFKTRFRTVLHTFFLHS